MKIKLTIAMFSTVIAATAIASKQSLADSLEPNGTILYEQVLNTDPNEAVSSVEVRLLETRELEPAELLESYANDCSSMEERKPFSPSADPISIGEIINIAEKVWKIVEKNQPVVETKEHVAQALPRGIQCWDDLAQWQRPKSQLYQIVYKNLFGAKVVNFKYRLTYTYGGRLKNQGRYLANVTMRYADLSVLWGYKFYANVEVPYVVNLGTDENPVAGMQLDLSWKVETVIKKSQSNMQFFVDGLGNAKTL